jgi:hypothetical protein
MRLIRPVLWATCDTECDRICTVVTDMAFYTSIHSAFLPNLRPRRKCDRCILGRMQNISVLIGKYP